MIGRGGGGVASPKRRDVCTPLLSAVCHRLAAMSSSPLDCCEPVGTPHRSVVAARRSDRMPTLDEAGSLALVRLDPDGRVAGWNAGAERLLGHRAEEIVGRHVGALHALDERVGLDHWLGQVARDGTHEAAGWRVHRDRTRIWVNVITTALRDQSSRLLGFLCVVRDASARRDADLAGQRTTESLRQLAATDALTGLKNRREFDSVLGTIPREPFAVLAIDVDRLKAVNDEQGHGAGDHLLRSVAITLSLLVRGWDVLARLGGDEFAVLIPGVGAAEAARVAERMRLAMHSVPSCRARVSVGWATGSAGADPRAVWVSADACLGRAKRAGGDQVVGGAEPAAGSGTRAADVLAAVLDGGRLDAVYQPIVALDDGRVAGWEALARPAGTGPIESVEPIFALARRSARIRDLDWLGRRAALRDARRLPPGGTLFLNVSLAALLDALHDVDQLLLLLRWADWPAASTVLELGERAGSVRRLTEVVASYRAEGIRFALNDSGERFASPTLLAAVRPEFVKIARRLTMTASRDTSRRRIEAALTFGRESGAAVIAEGVENRFAAEQMRDLGVELGQGFGLAEPAGIDVVEHVAAPPLRVQGRDVGR